MEPRLLNGATFDEFYADLAAQCCAADMEAICIKYLEKGCAHKKSLPLSMNRALKVHQIPLVLMLIT